MKKILFLLLILFPLVVNAQMLKERRVYYFDCSYSMVINKLDQKVKNNLINAINNIVDQTTEIYVIPFAVDGDENAVLQPWITTASDEGKRTLIEKINNLTFSRSSMTYHKDPIEDFYNNNRALSGQKDITYMFLMTDGQDEWNDKNRFLNDLRQWGNKYGDQNVYGFYVMLDAVAHNAQVEKIVDAEPHFWNVESADVNINMVRAESNWVYNIREGKGYAEVPITGNLSGLKFSVSGSSTNYSVGNCAIKNGKLRINLNFPCNVSVAPDSEVLTINLTMDGGKQLDILLTDKIKLTCINKKEKSLNPTFL